MNYFPTPIPSGGNRGHWGCVCLFYIQAKMGLLAGA